MNPFARWFQINGFARVRRVDSFWRRVDKSIDASQCWLWTGGRSGAGYGYLWWRGQHLYAHRVAYELVNGPIPPGLEIRHHCDNPLCCRPSHLTKGRHWDNMQDMAARGRRKSFQLSADAVALIRQSDSPSPVLAAEFGVSPTAIQMVRRGESYPGAQPYMFQSGGFHES
jgi:hypothetical protein